MSPTTTAQHGGLTLGRQSSVLIDRALELLAAGPADSQSVVARVCQIPAVAGSLADHLAAALLGADDRFVRTADGWWCLAASNATASHPSGSFPAMPGLPWRHEYVMPTDERSEERRDLRSHLVHDDALAATPFAVVDVETTGGSAYAGDRITEIAVVRVNRGTADVVFDSLVNPQRPIPAAVTRLTSITQSMVRGAPTFREIAPQLAGVLQGHVFVAHNAQFDWRFVGMEMERATGRPLVGPRICTVKLARRFLPVVRRRSLDSLSHHYGVENTARHRAGGDAIATAQVFLRLLDSVRMHGCTTLDDVTARLNAIPKRGRRKKRRARPYSASDDASA